MAPHVVGLAPSYCLRQLAVPVALAMVSGRTRKLNLDRLPDHLNASTWHSNIAASAQNSEIKVSFSAEAQETSFKSR